MKIRFDPTDLVIQGLLFFDQVVPEEALLNVIDVCWEYDRFHSYPVMKGSEGLLLEFLIVLKTAFV